MTVVYISIAIIVLVSLGKINLPGNVRADQQYNPNNARFNTPGRNARQRQLAERKRERQVRQREEIVLENYEEEWVAGKGQGEAEGE